MSSTRLSALLVRCKASFTAAPQTRNASVLRPGVVIVSLGALLLIALMTRGGWAQEGDEGLTNLGGMAEALELAPAEATSWLPTGGMPGAIPTVLVLSALSLAPAILLMTTSFVRIVVVLGLLRQALGLPQLPPTQVVTALALFLTILVMTPVWTDVYEQAVVPYQNKSQPITAQEAWTRGIGPLRQFMSRQIEAAGNSDDVWLFYGYLPQRETQAAPTTYDDVPLQALLPAFLLSELKVAFLIGFQIFLPFLVVDLVVASVTTSMGMVMLPPSLVSLPLKLLLFVMLNGWHLVVEMLLRSFAPYAS